MRQLEASTLRWNKHIVCFQDQLDYPQCKNKSWNGIKVNHHCVLNTVTHVWNIDIVSSIEMGQWDHNNDHVLLHLDNWITVVGKVIHYIEMIWPISSLWFCNLNLRWKMNTGIIIWNNHNIRRISRYSRWWAVVNLNALAFFIPTALGLHLSFLSWCYGSESQTTFKGVRE